MRLVQHKLEAYWFYRFLSIFYDKIVNPLFWTKSMRDQSLTLAQLNDPNLEVVDVGSGTGFTTEGIVKSIPGKNVTCIDQSPHQMSKAKRKEALADCTFMLGDAENLPFETDRFDRYVSAGSIEYWPHPQLGITEAYRVIKPGGVALMIGPLEPKEGAAKFFANTWMLFPKDQEYRSWFENAGFQNIKVRYIRPHWFQKKSEYGIAISGTKPTAGLSPIDEKEQILQQAAEKPSFGRRLQMIWRVLVGSTAGFVFIPAALWGYLINTLRGSQKDVPAEYKERLNTQQIIALVLITLAVIAIIGLIIK